MWEHTSSFLRRVTGVVLLSSLFIWVLMATPVRGEGRFAHTDLRDSAFAAISQTIAPALSPLGFGSWENTGALISGLVAKEVVVSTLAQVHGANYVRDEVRPASSFFEDVGSILTGFIGATLDTFRSLPLIVGINLFADEEQAQPTRLMTDVRDSVTSTSGGHGTLAAVAFMVFVLLYTPCVVAASAGRQELGVRWLLFSVFGQLGLAWLLAFLVFQGGVLLGLG